MSGKAKARAKLAAMRRSLSMSQSYLAGRGQMPGKGIGVGSVDSRREGETARPETMVAERLTGQKGSGPSETMVEDTDSGSGVSSRRGVAKVERTFAQQVEQFVERDDVPEEMKRGVREYFERIHQAEVPTQ